MPVTQTDIDNLTKAIKSGERQVTYGSTTVTYRSIDDLIKARDRLQKDLDAQNVQDGSKKPRRRMFYAYQNGRGFD